MQITYHADPSHGWAEIPVSLIQELGISGQISPYSYIKGNKAYLEEDCDLGLFLRAYKATGREVSFTENHINQDHWIRNLPRWSKS